MSKDEAFLGYRSLSAKGLNYNGHLNCAKWHKFEPKSLNIIETHVK